MQTVCSLGVTLALAFCAISPLCKAEELRAVSPSVDRTIKIGDELSIQVRNEPELSGWVLVRLDGTIYVPLLNSRLAVGFTPSGLASLLANDLKTYVKSPQVTVSRDGTVHETPSRPRKWLSDPQRNKTPELPPLWPSATLDSYRFPQSR
jgi:hypothetical protein